MVWLAPSMTSLVAAGTPFWKKHGPSGVNVSRCSWQLTARRMKGEQSFFFCNSRWCGAWLGSG